MTRLLALAVLAACSSQDGDTAPAKPDPTESCAPEDHEALNLIIGTGQGGDFTPLEEGESVTLDVAPQGGYGVSVRAKTAGLNTEEAVEVLLETEIAGEQSGSFINQGTNLYCQDDGQGLLWGVVVGFDQDVFPTPDALIAIDGEQALLIVEATDVDGRAARGEVIVTIEVGG